MHASLQIYYITDSTQLKALPLEMVIAHAIDAGVDWVQIREKEMPARRLLSVARHAVTHARERGHTRVIVNDRLDVALTAGAHGVHLGVRSMPIGVARKLAPPEFIVGASCHSLEEARAAQDAGAHYILLGPVFDTPSKLQYGAPLGIAALRDVSWQVSIPVFALGGITLDRVAVCRENGAAGIAAIRLFQDVESMEELVRQLREATGA